MEEQVDGTGETPAFERVRLAIEGAVATLTLDDQPVMNAMSPAMLEEIAQALRHIAAPDAGVRCLLITGAGRAFSTGANLQQMTKGEAGSGPRDAGSLLETGFHPILRRLRDLPIPIVTAVNGPAAGAGMSLALMGDLILCARSAYFLQAFRRIGLVPDCGSTWLLPRLIGRARAMELSLLGEKLPAETALEWGLVNRVYDDAALLGEATALARNLADGPTLALGLMRRLYWEATESSHEEQIEMERRFQLQAGASADFKEGVAAFLEKRPARFTGR
ncbi:MAG TPA: enoyl-CoA hydratase/isomerase [Enterovirga sp.]|jgi:2-(1,2-epoxy-1,2-dihydrophenyl)acetyl-CoA isomerase|nr:enoyl-CoA hydratase/isomerase [Enterovirga sp.]